MGIYALTGGATGIGAAIKTQLRALGHEVIVVDLREGEFAHWPLPAWMGLFPVLALVPRCDHCR